MPIGKRPRFNPLVMEFTVRQDSRELFALKTEARLNELREIKRPDIKAKIDLRLHQVMRRRKWLRAWRNRCAKADNFWAKRRRYLPLKA